MRKFAEYKQAEINGLLQFKSKQFRHRQNLPILEGNDQALSQRVCHTGAAQTSLSELAFPYNPEFLKALKRLSPQLQALPSSAICPEDVKTVQGHITFVDPEIIIKDFPEILLWGLQDRVLDILENIVGLPVNLIELIIRKEIPNGRQTGTRLWHRDGEDISVGKILIYLTDVDIDGGPFEYIPRSDFPRLNPRRSLPKRLTDPVMETVVPREKWNLCIGPAQSAIFVDTAKVYHRGRLPKRERIALIYSYTSANPLRPHECQEKLLQQGLPYLTHPLTQRQANSLYRLPKDASTDDLDQTSP